MKIERRDFLMGSAFLAAAGALKEGKAMMPSEQRAYDKWYATEVPPAEGILGSEPVLQVPGPDTMGIAFAVNALAIGYAEVAENPEMKGAVRVLSDGFPRANIDSRILRVRLSGLKPGTRYWYRVGAARIVHPGDCWSKQSDIAWSQVHSFVTTGEGAPSHFAMMCDTHAQYGQMARITAKYRELGVPFVVWNGDVPASLTNDREAFVRHYLAVPENDDYAADAALLFNRGNHDYRGDAVNFLGDVMMTRLPSERCARDAALERNFAVRIGAVAIIGLDTGEDKPDNHVANGGYTAYTRYRQMQAEWLKDQFKRPEIASAPFVVASLHIPIFDPDPNANPGTILEDYAHWQKECAELWGPTLTENRVQLVLAGHIHRYRYDPATPTRPWAQIVGGGRGKNTQTLVEGMVLGGELVVRVYNTDLGKLVATHRFARR